MTFVAKYCIVNAYIIGTILNYWWQIFNGRNWLSPIHKLGVIIGGLEHCREQLVHYITHVGVTANKKIYVR